MKNIFLLFLCVLLSFGQSFAQSTGILATDVDANDQEVLTWDQTLNKWIPSVLPASEVQVYTASVSGESPNNTPTGDDAIVAVNQFGQQFNWNADGLVWVQVGTGGQSTKRITAVDYNDVRSTSGADFANSITIEDFSYTFNGVAYTTKGGIFYKTISGTEDGAMTIVATDGTIWQRLWEHPYGVLELWEVGGYDQNGNNYSPFTGGGISGESDRLQAALSTFGVIECETREYILDEEAGTVFENTVINANGATWKRADQLTTTLTASVSGNQTAFQVADVTGFEVGMIIRLLDVSAPNGGQGFDENSSLSVLRIQSINQGTNTINVIANTNQSGTTFVAGDIVYHDYTILGRSSAAATSTYNLLEINNLIFDGNKDNNQATQDWRYNRDFSPGDGLKLNVSNCTFENYAATCFFPNIGTFESCTWRNGDGPPVHIGSALNLDWGYGEILQTGIYFDKCKFYDVNQFPNNISQHSEAAITFSVGVAPVTITNCEFINQEKHFGNIFAPVSVSDFKYVRMENCYAENYTGICTQSTATTQISYEHIVLNNNYFKNCGDISFSGNNLTEGFDTYNHRITNNIITNGRLFIQNGSRLEISNNQFFIDIEDPNYEPFPNQISGQEPMIQIINSSDIIFHNNLISGHPENAEPLIRNGLLLQHNNARMLDDAGNPTDYLYMQNVSVKGNTFMNFTTAITTYQDVGYAQSPDFQTVGWIVKDNTVFMAEAINHANTSDGNSQCGILVDNGVIADGNVIYMPTRLASNGRAMIVMGIDDDPSANNTAPESLFGGIATNNYIFAPDNTQTIRLGNSGSRPEKNIIFNNNYYQGDISDAGGALNRLDGDGNAAFKNYRMSGNGTAGTTIMSSAFTPIPPTYKNWRENKGLY